MLTIFMTVGLPASGKSTWAEKKMAEEPGAFKRVNKDLLRECIDCGKWSSANEKFILKVRDCIIRKALADGKHVIVDDTNLAPKHRQRIEEIAKDHHRETGQQVAVKVVDFTDIDVETCIERDLKRLRSVGERVIRKMYDDYLRPKSGPPAYDPKLPNGVIIDLDGTIAINNGHRGWFDFSKCYDDEPNRPVINAIEAYLSATTATPIFVSGREDSCREETLRFIREKTPLVTYRFFELYMRKTGDHRDDGIVKREIYEAHIKGRYNIAHVYDDRDRVVRVWRHELGLPVFQVADGNF